MGSDTEERKEAAKEVTTIPALYVPPYRLIPLRSLLVSFLTSLVSCLAERSGTEAKME